LGEGENVVGGCWIGRDILMDDLSEYVNEKGRAALEKERKENECGETENVCKGRELKVDTCFKKGTLPLLLYSRGLELSLSQPKGGFERTLLSYPNVPKKIDLNRIPHCS
jgi:hypothetical protein